MKKAAILFGSLLAASFLLSLFMVQRIERIVPGKVAFLATGLWDSLISYLVMTAAILLVLSVVLGTGKLLTKKFKWGKWKAGLVCALESACWVLIFWLAFQYSVHAIKNFTQMPGQISAAPALLSLRPFVFYFLRNALLGGVVLHVIMLIGWLIWKKRGRAVTPAQ